MKRQGMGNQEALGNQEAKAAEQTQGAKLPLAAHTPGPWKVYHALLRPQFPGSKIIEVQDADGNAVILWSGFDNSDRLKKTHLANARLIVAAPMFYDLAIISNRAAHEIAKNLDALSANAADWSADEIHQHAQALKVLAEQIIRGNTAGLALASGAQP